LTLAPRRKKELSDALNRLVEIVVQWTMCLKRGIDTGRPDWANFRLLGDLGNFLKITCIQKWHTFLGYFFPRHKICINFDLKNMLGCNLGDFFTNSSGHPINRYH
jgi:hypothetical protein